MEWHSVYYDFEATRLRVTKYRTSTIDVNRTDIGSLRKHPFLPISDGDVSRETSPAAKSEEKRMFSQASFLITLRKLKPSKIHLNLRCMHRYAID